MSKIHITLVGGQPAPIYHGIVATNPDYVLYIYSAESQKVLDVLKQEIDLPSEFIELDATSPEKIRNCAQLLVERYIDDDVTVNITSGLKSWSHWFGVVFDKQPNASVIYMDQNNVMWNYRTMQPNRLFPFDLHSHFRLYGNSIENNYQPFADYTEEDDEALRKIEEIRRYNQSEFNDLLAVLDNKKQQILKQSQCGKFEHPISQSYVEWEKTSADKYGFVRIYLTKKNIGKEVFFESPHAVGLAFNSGWFEYKVAKILSTWDRCKELCMNCRFPFRQNIDKNETDIIVNTGTKPLFVECKTHIAKPTDIDKFNSVIKHYGGMGSKGLFITESSMTEFTRRKCEEYGIMAFSFKDSHLGLSSEKALFLLLNTELDNINTK